MTSPLTWQKAFETLRQTLDGERPSLNVLDAGGATPFQILIATLLSLRTKDEVTLKASKALFAKAATPQDMLTLSEDEIAQTIFPVGFYKTKAGHIREISQILLDSYQGTVPSDKETLLALPGVGPKTANLVLGLAFGVQAICVDTHVHRIANRWGWVQTHEPEETEKALEELLPREIWIDVNELLVQFGQTLCGPASPHCQLCPLTESCPRIGVLHHR